jgi:GT2 family glycosyltransferase/predicted HAD superfamily hydrolase
VSDTFFNKNQLVDILKSNQIESILFDHIFASCEYKTSKSQSLFKEVLLKTKLIPSEIFHIGDNYNADIIGSMKYNIKSYYYKQYTYKQSKIINREDAINNNNYLIYSFNSLRSLISNTCKVDNYKEYFEYGSFMIGPIMALFADWIVDNAKKYNIKKILPFMREGELLSQLIIKVVEHENIELEVKPVYLSRQSINLASLIKMNYKELERRFYRPSPLSVEGLINTFGLTKENVQLTETELIQKVERSNDNRWIFKLLLNEKIKAQIKQKSEIKRKEFISYFNTLIDKEDKRIGVVDLGWGGTIQRNINNIIRKENIPIEVFGFYLATDQRSIEQLLEGSNIYGFLGSGGLPDKNLNPIFRSVVILEQAINAFCGTTVGYKNGTPVLEEYFFKEEEMLKRKMIQKGILEYQKLWLQTRSKNKKPFESDMYQELKNNALVLLGRLSAIPFQEEAEIIGDLTHDENYGNNNTIKICDEKIFESANNDLGKLFSSLNCYWPQGSIAIGKKSLIDNTIKMQSILWSKPIKEDKLVETTAIGMISYNNHEILRLCIDSIISSINPDIKIFIFDNNSDIDTIKSLGEYELLYDNIRVIYSKINLGFPSAVNQLLCICKKEFFIILNNDIIVTDKMVEKLVEVAESDSKIGMVGPISNEVSGLQKDNNAKYSTIEEMHKYAAEVREKNKDQILHFPRIAFLCTLIKREVIDKIGGLDERFSPGNYEDDDYCLRAQLAGFKTVIAKDVFIHHYGSKSFKADGGNKYAELLEINKQKFIDKWGVTPDELWLQNKPIKPHQIIYPINTNLFTQYYERAKVNIADNEYQLAIESLKNAVSAYKSNGNIESAIQYPDLLNIAGNISLVCNDLISAKEYFEEELKTNPDSSSACVGLGEIFFRNNQMNEAKVMFEWGVKNNPENQIALTSLSKINRELGLNENHNSLN